VSSLAQLGAWTATRAAVLLAADALELEAVRLERDGASDQASWLRGTIATMRFRVEESR
jgi:hypothetical protein